MRLAILLLIVVSTFSCAEEQERADQRQDSTRVIPDNPNPDSISQLSPQQQIAFDAFNAIQVQGEHLYSTFSGIHHDCSSPDSSFVITRIELQIALEELLSLYYTPLSVEERNKLANEAVQAQEEYLVLQCGYSIETSGGNIPDQTSGTWILPEVLSRRDIIIVW